jgi:cation diffusion facilitator family transporter
MSDCCTDKGCELERLHRDQAWVLKLALGINLALFVIETAAGAAAGSSALLADALDMLGDAAVYGFSLYAVGRSAVWKARAALSKAGIMGVLGAVVLAQAIGHALHPEVMPHAGMIGWVGLLALLANLACFGLLWRHRSDDLNMRSVWMCSRNDVLANLSVLVAAGGVAVTRSAWPDILVGTALALLFLRSAAHVARSARRDLIEPPAPVVPAAVPLPTPAAARGRPVIMMKAQPTAPAPGTQR